MAINVTLVEVKTQEPKPFPKLMIGDDGKTIIEVLEKPNKEGFTSVIYRTGSRSGSYTTKFKLINGAMGFTDYNEPITIQNA